jgi:hypothetical protein
MRVAHLGMQWQGKTVQFRAGDGTAAQHHCRILVAMKVVTILYHDHNALHLRLGPTAIGSR